jgi:hypothetical protein
LLVVKDADQVRAPVARADHGDSLHPSVRLRGRDTRSAGESTTIR